MTQKQKENFTDYLATWLPAVAVVMIVANLFVFAYHWMMNPYHFLTVTLGVILMMRKVRFSPAAGIALALGYLLFYLSIATHLGQTQIPSSMPGSVPVGPMGTTAGGSVAR